MPEQDKVVRHCFQKEKEERGKMAGINGEGAPSFAFTPLPVVSTECDPSCEGEIRETRHLGGIALPQFFDKRICPMQQRDDNSLQTS